MLSIIAWYTANSTKSTPNWHIFFVFTTSFAGRYILNFVFLFYFQSHPYPFTNILILPTSHSTRLPLTFDVWYFLKEISNLPVVSPVRKGSRSHFCQKPLFNCEWKGSMCKNKNVQETHLRFKKVLFYTFNRLFYFNQLFFIY